MGKIGIEQRGLSIFMKAFGGGNVVSPTFGAALWLVDCVMQMLLSGAERLYFHQATPDSVALCE